VLVPAGDVRIDCTLRMAGVLKFPERLGYPFGCTNLQDVPHFSDRRESLL
jgi:hypothetical protein